MLIQPNLDVGDESRWTGPGEWEAHMAQFRRLAGEECKTYIAGIPQTGAGNGETACPTDKTHPDLVVWPESPAPFFEEEPRFQQGMAGVARAVDAPMIVNGIGSDFSGDEIRYYVSAIAFGAEGNEWGGMTRSILVPFGEYIPFEKLLIFAHKLTGRVSKFNRGDGRARCSGWTGIGMAFSSATSQCLRTRCGSLRGWAQRCW